jgi:ribosomal protein S15P/S13E
MAPSATKTVHLPAFQSKDVEFWFYQVEALFRTANITNDQAKYDHVLAALDLTAASDVRDVIRNPPEEDLYNGLKKALTDRLAVSEASRIKRILSNEQMGTRSPSQHLRHLQATAGNNFSSTVLTSIWMEALPADVKLIIAGDAGLPLDKLAAMADRIMDVAGPRRNAVNEVVASASNTDKQLAALTKQISALTKHLTGQAVDQMQTGNQNDPAARKNRSRSPATPRKRSFDAAKSGTCWYHWRFKEKATKCTPPCTWNQGNGLNE